MTVNENFVEHIFSLYVSSGSSMFATSLMIYSMEILNRRETDSAPLTCRFLDKTDGRAALSDSTDTDDQFKRSRRAAGQLSGFITNHNMSTIINSTAAS